MATRVDPLRAGGPAAASLLVNALLLTGLLSLGIGQAGRERKAPTVTVMSLAAIKGAEDAEDEPETPAAEPRRPVEERVSSPAESHAEILPQPIVRPVALIPVMPVSSPVNTMMPVQASAPAAASSQLAAAQQSAAASAAPAPPVRRGTAEGLNAKAPPGTSNSYAAKVRSWLYAHKIYPRRAKMRREEGKVRVRFVIDRAGVLMEGVLIDRSGNDALDEEATAMMRRASPYPKAPPEIPGDRIEFVVPIEFTLPV